MCYAVVAFTLGGATPGDPLNPLRVELALAGSSVEWNRLLPTICAVVAIICFERYLLAGSTGTFFSLPPPFPDYAVMSLGYARSILNLRLGCIPGKHIE